MRKEFIALIIVTICMTSVADERIYRCPGNIYATEVNGEPPAGCKKLDGTNVVIQRSPVRAPKPPTREEKYESCKHDAAMKAPTDAGLKIALEICKNRFDKSK
jgi:hypothetical protein